MNKTITVTLTDKEQAMLDEWLGHIKAIYGDYGLLTWKLTPDGIGVGVSVYSHHTKTEIELTDYESW